MPSAGSTSGAAEDIRPLLAYLGIVHHTPSTENHGYSPLTHTPLNTLLNQIEQQAP